MLPPCLQRCFALCSLYPKGYHIEEVEDFVRLWIAQGFVEVPSNSTVTLEDEAMHYFNELLSKSFFQKNIGNQGIAYYGMHDLVHDLAENVSKDYCFRIEDDRLQSIPANVVHLSALSYEDISTHLSDIVKPVNLRTLIIVDSWSIGSQDDISDFIQQVSMKFKKLRMLRLGGGLDLIKLDKSVGSLKHLRYLQVSAVEELPESLGKLYHLQFLVIKISIMKQFGIGQLKNLQQLRGSLLLYKLENVKDKAEASKALLKEKKHVDTLELHWERQSYERDGSIDEEVLEGLQPHPNLGALKLDGYNGVRLPKWTRNDGSLSSSDLYFVALERLHSLEIVDCDNLQQIPSLPRMLGRLVIKGCENLSEVPLLPLGLRVLTVHGSPKLVELQLPVSSHIEDVDLEDCGGVEAMFSNMSENGSSSSSSLRRLRIVRCSSIHHGGENDMLLMSTSLTHLELTGLPWLTSALLGPNLTALEYVRIENCENLRSIGNSLVYSSSLEYLRIKDCPRLTVQQQADDHRGGGVMQTLIVEGCPELTLLWNLNCFTSVRELRVKGCPKLTLIKSGGGGGDDSLSPMPSSSSSPLERVTIDDLSLLTAALPRRESLCLNSLWSLTIEESTQDDKPLTAEQEELFQHHLTSFLTYLKFRYCVGLTSLPANLENLSSLSYLCISDCPKIESLPNLPASLVELYIDHCPKIESLPNLPASLTELDIEDCPKFESLPNLPASLRYLTIWDCPKIGSLPNLPASLGKACISGCHPRLKEKYGNDERIKIFR